jgi:hypothetical protein
MPITPDIIAKLDRYIELQQENAKFDLYVATGQPHDITASICAEIALKKIETELLEAGLFRWSANEIVDWARRKV